MGDIVFCCQHCRDSLIVDATGIGVELPCPRCNQSIQIPDTAIPAETVQDLVFTEQVGPLPPAVKDTLRRLSSASELPVPPAAESERDLSSSTLRYAAMKVPTRRGLLAGLTMIGLVTVGLALALYVQAMTGFTPPEVMEYQVPPRPKVMQAQVGRVLNLGPVSLLAHRAALQKAASESGGVVSNLLVDLSLENTSGQSLFLGYLWSDLQVRDDQGLHIQSYRADAFTPLQPPQEILPGSVQRVPVTFGPVPSTSNVLTLRGLPGVWQKAPNGEYTPYSLPEFLLTLSRKDIQAAPR